MCSDVGSPADALLRRADALLTEFQSGGRSQELTIRALRLALDGSNLVELLCGVRSFETNMPLVVRWQADQDAVAWLRECYGYALPLLLAAGPQETTPAGPLAFMVPS